MKITFTAVSAYDDNHHILSIETEPDETIHVGQVISIMLTDETYIEREISSLRKWVLKPNAKRGKWIDVDSVSNGETCEADVYGINGHVQTTSMPSPAERRRWAQMICLTPYKELRGGEESIYDHIRDGYKVPDKVIAYLRTTKPFLMSPGIYDHPFQKEKRLLGPYLYTDDTYYWDRDTWKYVVKYGLELPKDFIDHVMSDAGTKFIEQQIDANESWSEAIKQWKKRKGFICLLPDNAGDKELKDF